MTRERDDKQGKGVQGEESSPESFHTHWELRKEREELRCMSFFKDLYPRRLAFDSGVGGKSYFGLRF